VARALDLAPELAHVRATRQSGARALLRIQDGCDEHCTFCATTIARGRNRSRAPEQLVAEANRLAEHHAEIVLTGVHIGSYGADRGSSLGALVERLVREVGRARFRLSSVEATEVDDRLAELLTGAPGRVAPHLHAPLQSGADRVLKRMGRHWYTSGSYAAAVERLAARADVLGLGADVVAGFPGEREVDHRATMALVESLPVTTLHVVPYSARPGTAAVRLPDAVPGTVARRRAAELRALAARKGAEHRARRVEGGADVVVVRGGEGREGITEDYLSVIPDPSIGRGDRYAAVLHAEGDRLRAEPHEGNSSTAAGP
jgi:threonylcarbamoyladenosine tRNA methylthiotransferase MtaB